MRSTVGGELRQNQIGGLKLLDLRVPPQWVTHDVEDTSSGEYSYLVTVHSAGRTEIYQDGVAAELSCGDLFFRDSSMPSQVRSDTHAHQIIAKIPKTLVKRAGVRWPAGSVHLPHTNGAAAAASAYLTELSQQGATIPQHMRSAVAENVILNLVTAYECERLPDGDSKLDVLFSRACALIMRRLRDPQLTVGVIASELGVSERYLHKAFSRRNQGAGRFIWNRRLAHCRGDLLDPGLKHRNLTEIAFHWGFSDASHFSRAFKARFGVRPSALRRLASDTR